MADFSYKSSSQIICRGFEGEVFHISNISGSANAGVHEYITEHSYQNTNNYVNFQTCTAKVKHNINITYDRHNLMNVTVTTTLMSFTTSGSAGYGYGGANYTIVFRPRNGSSSGFSLTYSPMQSGTWATNRVIGTNTMTGIYPGQTTTTSDFYLCNFMNGYANEGSCNNFVDKCTTGLQFTNNRSLIYDVPEIKNTTCAGNGTGLRLAAEVDFGEFRPGTKNWVEYEVSKFEDFSVIAWSGSKTGNNDRNQALSIDMIGLQPNSKYYVRYRASNNDKMSDWTTCEAVTLTTNILSDAKSGFWSEGEARLAIQMGDGYYQDPTTKIYLRKCGEGDDAWEEVMTRTTKTVATLLFTGLEEKTCYEAQARTTTPAGTYTGNIVSFTTPDKNLATAKFTEIDPKIDEDTMETFADICYHYVSSGVPVYITVYYRVKNGFDDTWIKVEEAVEFNDLEGDYCFTIHDLFPNQTVYEMYIHTEVDGNPWDSEISEFVTPLLPLPENCTCDNFNYLLALICQAVKPIYEGNKTIYANPTTKELCDPYSENPTLATLWSRILRFDSAAACMMCDMLELLQLKNGNYDQYFVAETGWTTIAREIVEESELLVTSGTVADYIAEKMHEVWHYHGEVDYIVNTLDEAPKDANTGETLLTASDSKMYEYDGSKWNEIEFEPDNFMVLHVNKSSDTSFGMVKAGQAYYYFGGKWNNLDADTSIVEAKVDRLESAKIAFPQSTTEDLMTIQTNKEDFNYNSLPNDKRVICYVVEDTDLPPRGSFRITYTTGPDATIIADEDVVSGATAQRPVDPIRTGYDFVRWEDSNVPGVEFNFSTPILKNYDLVAIWEPKTVLVTFDIREGLGTTGYAPADVQAHYGDPVPMPDDSTFSLAGGTFAGWLREGVPVKATDTLKGDTTLVAYFQMDEFDVKLHPNNGQDDTTYHLSYGNSVSKPSDPIRQDYVFVGWYTDEVGGQLFNFDAPLYGPTDVYARWVPATYTITFKPGGGNENFTQTVNYLDTVTEPPMPTWKGDA